MVLSLAAVLAAAAHAGPAVMPSFENLLLDARAAVHATRAAQRAEKSSNLGPRIDRAAWDLQRWQRDAQDLRRNLQLLKSRLNRRLDAPARPGRPGPGRPDDSQVRWDVQRVGRQLEQHARDLRWTLQELQSIRQAITEKDPELAGPANRLDGANTWFASDERWLENELRFIGFDLRRAGFHFEAFDYERHGRDIDSDVRGIEDETRQILAKVR